MGSPGEDGTHASGKIKKDRLLTYPKERFDITIYQFQFPFIISFFDQLNYEFFVFHYIISRSAYLYIIEHVFECQLLKHGNIYEYYLIKYKHN